MIERLEVPPATEVNRGSVVRQSIHDKIAQSVAYTADGRHAPPPTDDETGGDGE